MVVMIINKCLWEVQGFMVERPTPFRLPFSGKGTRRWKWQPHCSISSLALLAAVQEYDDMRTPLRGRQHSFSFLHMRSKYAIFIGKFVPQFESNLCMLMRKWAPWMGSSPPTDSVFVAIGEAMTEKAAWNANKSLSEHTKEDSLIVPPRYRWNELEGRIALASISVSHRALVLV